MPFSISKEMLSCCGVLLLFVSLTLPAIHAGRARSPNEWASMGEDDWKKADKDLEEGDAEDELVTEGQLLYDEMERRRNQAPPPPDPAQMMGGDPSDIMAAMNRPVAGPTMLFATLNHTLKDGSKLTKDETVEFAVQWRDLLFTGGLEVQCYDIEWDKILVTMQRGWDADPLLEFLLDQEPVVEVMWNDKKHLPKRLQPKESGKAGSGKSTRKKKRKPANAKKKPKKKTTKKKKKKKKKSKKKPGSPTEKKDEL